MKKIFVLILLILLNVNIVFAEKNEKNYSIYFNGSKFNLLYSIKNKDFGGYLNEYYKKGDTYNIWSELVAVHHFPNAYSPIDRIKDFKDYLGSMHIPSSLTFDDKKNTAMIDFIMINDHSLPVVIEFNIFKYEKSKKCGSIAIQYARRYTATTTLQIEAIKKDIEKNRKNLISKIKNFEIPEIITKDIDKCISAADITKEQKSEDIQKVAMTSKNAEETINNENNDITTTEETVDTTDKNEVSAQTQNEDSVKEDNITYESLKTEEKTSENVANRSPETDDSTSKNNTEKEEISAISESKNENSNSDKITKEENAIENSAKQEDNKQTAAPVPIKNNSYENINNNTKNKKTKNNTYEVSNNKNDFIAVPRTKKELKEEIRYKKQSQKDKAKQLKIQAKADKKAAKIDAKNRKKQEKIDKILAKVNLNTEIKQNKINKKEAIKAEKQAKKTYTISNSNSDLIASPRTKKEIKAHNKKMRKELKERVKRAKKKLDT